MLAVFCAVVGSIALLPPLSSLWHTWLNEPLKSIGAIVPVTCLLLILRAWKKIGWQTNGTWWGVAVIAVAFLLVRLRDQSLLILAITPHSAITLPPVALILFAYVSGLVLLFGGTRLYRAALFPIFLIVLVNPVPEVFTQYLDIPLQQASAHVARSFAVAMGQPLNDAGLKLMFTPKFGMFIAPGCNGIRGAVTLGMIALIVGHLFRFRRGVHAAVVVGAVLLGYLCNFLRLCILVLYYLVGLHWVWLQKHGTGADYIIGGTIFLFAVFSFVTVVLKLKDSPRATMPEKTYPPAHEERRGVFWLKPAVFLALTLMMGTAYVRTAYAMLHQKSEPDAEALVQTLPKQLGSFHLMNTRVQKLFGGPVTYFWGDYATADGDRQISIGIAPKMGVHDPLFCHTAVDEYPVWREINSTPSAGGPFNAISALYARPTGFLLELSSVCSEDACGAYGTEHQYFRLVYSKPSPHALLGSDPKRPIPVVLQTRTSDTSLSSEAARAQLSSDIALFLSETNVVSMANALR